MTHGAGNMVLVLGATSGIGRHVAAAFARRGYALYVTGRDLDEAGRVASDLALRYDVHTIPDAFDARDTRTHGDFFRRVIDATDGRLAGVVAAFGLLGDHEASARCFDAARAVIDVNFTGAVSILTLAADHLAVQRSGFVAAITSVAGDRGRQSNYVYGAAKGALSLYLQGLRNRLFHSGVRVVTIKPGFVDTGMTYGLPGVSRAWSPAAAGEAVARAVERGRDVAYVPWFWRWIMLLIRLVPERIFKRLRL